MKTVYHIPGNTHPINEIYVVLSKDNKGEGIVNANINGQGFQLVTSSKDTLEKVISLSKKIHKETGVDMSVYKFSHKELIEKIG